MILPIMVVATSVRSPLKNDLTLNFSLVETVSRESFTDAENDSEIEATVIRMQSGMLYYVKESPEMLHGQTLKEISSQIHQAALVVGRYQNGRMR